MKQQMNRNRDFKIEEDEEERKKKKKKRYCEHSEINQVPNIIWVFIILF